MSENSMPPILAWSILLLALTPLLRPTIGHLWQLGIWATLLLAAWWWVPRAPRFIIGVPLALLALALTLPLPLPPDWPAMTRLLIVSAVWLTLISITTAFGLRFTSQD